MTTEENNNDNLLTAEDVAKKLSMSPGFVRHLWRTGQMDHFTLGGRSKRTSLEYVQSYLDNKKVDAV